MNYSKIKDLADQKKIKLTELSEKIGLSKTGLYKTISNKSMKVDTLEAIAKELNMPIWHFLDVDPEEKYKAVLLEAENKIVELNKAVNDLRLDIKKWETSFSARDTEVDFLTEKYNTLDKLFQEKSAIVEEYKELIKNLKGLADTRERPENERERPENERERPENERENPRSSKLKTRK